jgi:iron complex transport system substrate-binding protein
MAARLSLLTLLFLLGCTEPVRTNEGPRIISLSPAATSVVVALGAADQLVGISRFCPEVPKHPNLPRLGGFIDPNLEAITLLEPSLVILTTSGRSTAKNLKRLGFESLQLSEAGLDGVIENYQRLGVALERQQAAKDMTERLRSLFVKQQTTPGKRTILVFAHEGGRFWLATPKGWLGELAQRVGLTVIPEGDKGFQAMSAEAIVKLEPDQILELRGHSAGQSSLTKIRALWARFPGMIKAQDIHLIEDQEILQPGASLWRTAQTLRSFGKNP